MNFKEYNEENDIKVSYKSVGEESITKIINPLLSMSKIYKRSVGFFSSSALNFISPGILELARNGGKIQIATSPILSEADVEAIKNGYDKRTILESNFESEFLSSIENLDLYSFELLSELISLNI